MASLEVEYPYKVRKGQKMGNLADAIERYLREKLGERDSVELRRHELAAFFGCAPSQINYVLSTRFTATRGFVVSSRRGGGGFIRITRLPYGIMDAIGPERVGVEELPVLLGRMAGEGIITRTEAALLERALESCLCGNELDPGIIRAKLLRAMLSILAGRGR